MPRWACASPRPGARLSTVRNDAIAASSRPALRWSVAQVEERRHVHRIAADDGLLERQRLVQAAERREQRGAVAQHVQVRRIERQRALEVLRRAGEVVVAVHRDPAEPGVGRCVVRIDRERLRGRLAGLGEPLLVGQQALASSR